MSETPTDIEVLTKRVRHQRRALAKLQEFHDKHKDGVPEPLGGYVEAEPIRQAVKELIRRRKAERDALPKLGEEWWHIQHQIDGLKMAYGQIDAVIRGHGAR